MVWSACPAPADPGHPCRYLQGLSGTKKSHVCRLPCIDLPV